jgi:hypothetical protein
MAFVIRQRLKELGLEQSDPTAAFPQEEFRKPKLGKPSFNPYEEAFGFVDFLSAGLTRRCNVLCGEGVTLSVFDREGRKCLRVVLNGETRYSLEVWMGGNVGDSSLDFYGLPGESNWSSGSTNAWAKNGVGPRSPICGVGVHRPKFVGALV